MLDPRALTMNALQGSTWLAQILRADGRRVVNIEQYDYNVEFLGVADNTSQQTTITIEPDSDFAILAMCGQVFTTFSGGVNIVPNATAQITDLGSGRAFFARPAMFQTVFGDNGLPLILPAPKALVAGTRLQVEVNCNTIVGAGTVDFYINLVGARIYYAN